MPSISSNETPRIPHSLWLHRELISTLDAHPSFSPDLETACFFAMVTASSSTFFVRSSISSRRFSISRWARLALSISTFAQLSSALTVELRRQFLALRRAGALPLQAWLERRGLGSCALPTHRELPFVYNWGVLRTPLFYQIKSLCNCTSAAPEPLVPQPKRSTVVQGLTWRVSGELRSRFTHHFGNGFCLECREIWDEILPTCIFTQNAQVFFLLPSPPSSFQPQTTHTSASALKLPHNGIPSSARLSKPGRVFRKRAWVFKL